MRNLPLTVTLCCATFLALPSTAVELVDGGAVSGGIIGGGTDHSGIDSPSNAEKVLFPENASCMNTSCESLGYVKGDVPGCTSYINCPLDATYKACIIYKDCNVTVSNVANRVRRVIVDVLSTTEDKLCDSANLKTDLGADSLDLIELRMALEDEFGRDIPDNTAEGISTIVDIIDFFSSSEYIFNLCPANGACEAKFKVVGCKEGYTVSVDDAGRASCTSSCTATLTSCPVGYECTSCTKNGKTYYEKTGNCASGYELGGSQCYDSRCAVTRVVGAQFILLDSGKKYITGCLSGYSANVNSYGCIGSCTRSNAEVGSDIIDKPLLNNIL